MIKIITCPDDVSQYLEEIEALANSLRKELGFIRSPAYPAAMYKGNLLVATVKQEPKIFAGFALLGGRFPTKRIFQLATHPDYCRQGVAKELVEKAVEDADKEGFGSVVIKVGETLDADEFWEKSGFDIEQNIKGGTVHPRVNLRVRDIRPSIFSASSHSISALQLAAESILSLPTLYLLDTNILLDVMLQRPDSEASQNLLRLVDEGDIKVVIAQEAVRELKKNSKKADDPVLEMAKKLDILSLTNGGNLIKQLEKLMFPHKDKISRHDASDIKHIATAISNKAKGFITRDEGILRKHKVLWEKFQLEVLSPAEFRSEDFLNKEDSSKLGPFTLKNVTSKKHLSISHELTDSTQKTIEEISPDHTINKDKFDYAFIRENNVISVICALEKRVPQGGKAKDAILFLPNNFSLFAATMAIDYIYKKSFPNTQTNIANPDMAISLSVLGDSESIPGLLIEYGYYKGSSGKYKKLFVGSAIWKQNWGEKRKAIKSLSSSRLPETPPDYHDFDQEFILNQGNIVPLNALENFLSTILILPNRGGAIVPIKEQYADDLFGHSPQGSLLSPPEAQLYTYKSYFGTHSSAACLTPGTIIFFYQSITKNSPGQIIALARIVRSNITEKENIQEKSKRRGVLRVVDIMGLTKNKKVLETVFTNSIILPKPVTLERLRELDYVSGANFVTATGITHQQVCSLIKEGGVL